MHLQCTMSPIFDREEVRLLGLRERVKTRYDNGLRIWIFSQKLPLSVKKIVSKTNLGSTIHYTYTSYSKYFRLCMVSEELRLNEIGLFLQKPSTIFLTYVRRQIADTCKIHVKQVSHYIFTCTRAFVLNVDLLLN